MAKKIWQVRPRLQLTEKEVRVGARGTVESFVRLGDVIEDSQPPAPSVKLSLDNEQVVAVCGKRGSGKSFTLGVISEGLCSDSEHVAIGKSHGERAAIMFDPLDIYWTTSIPVRDVSHSVASENYQLARRYGVTDGSFNVAAFVPGANSRRSSDPDAFQTLTLSVGELSENDWEILLDVNLRSDTIGQALVDVLDASRNGYSRNSTPVSGSANPSIGDLVQALDSDDLSGIYHSETLRALRQRLRSVDRLGLFATEGTFLSDLLKPGRLTVILLNRLDDSLRDIVIALITRRIYDLRSVAAFEKKRLLFDPEAGGDENLQSQSGHWLPRCTILIDEAHLFLGPGGAKPGKQALTKIAKEGRNMGLSLVMATQQPAAIDKQVLSQVETFISHQLVTSADVDSLTANLKCDTFESATFSQQTLDFKSLVRNLRKGECVVSGSDTSLSINRTFLTRIRPRSAMHGGIEV